MLFFTDLFLTLHPNSGHSSATKFIEEIVTTVAFVLFVAQGYAAGILYTKGTSPGLKIIKKIRPSTKPLLQIRSKLFGNFEGNQKNHQRDEIIWSKPSSSCSWHG